MEYPYLKESIIQIDLLTRGGVHRCNISLEGLEEC